MIKMSPSHLVSTVREVEVINVLKTQWAAAAKEHGYIETVFEVRLINGTTFFLVEAGDVTIEEYMKAQGNRNASAPWTGMALTLRRSVPILIDVLRGCRDLERVGLTHGGVTPENIFLQRDRAFLRGLGSVCRCNGEDSELSCKGLEDPGGVVSAFGSTFWQPPEAIDGSPCGSNDHTWAAGMLFAFLSLGYIPVEEFFVTRKLQYKDWSAARAALAWYFSIEEAPHFSELGEEVQHILRGLLVPSAQRWDTDRALKEFELLAKANRIPVPEPRDPPTLPVSNFHGDDRHAGMRPRGGSYGGPPRHRDRDRGHSYSEAPEGNWRRGQPQGQEQWRR